MTKANKELSCMNKHASSEYFLRVFWQNHLENQYWLKRDTGKNSSENLIPPSPLFSSENWDLYIEKFKRV